MINCLSSKLNFLFIFLIISFLLLICCGYQHYRRNPKWHESRRTIRGHQNLFGRSEKIVKTTDAPRVQNQPSPRIVGGRVAKYGDVPYQVAVVNWADNAICGGALVEVNELRFVITAAHCVWVGDVNSTSTVSPENVTIGASDLNIYKKEVHDQQFLVSRIVVHEWYDPRYYLNDIALIFLKSYAFINLGTSPADLPEPDFDNPDYITMSGYGAAEAGGDLDGFLKIVEVALFDWDDCKKLNTYLTNDHFCTGNTHPGTLKGFCDGDSGGPGVGYNYSQQRFYLYGVVSTALGADCGSVGIPERFTRLSKHIEWIRGFALTHILYCGNGNPYTDPPSKYPNCPWPFDNPCYVHNNC